MERLGREEGEKGALIGTEAGRRNAAEARGKLWDLLHVVCRSGLVAAKSPDRAVAKILAYRPRTVSLRTISVPPAFCLLSPSFLCPYSIPLSSLYRPARPGPRVYFPPIEGAFGRGIAWRFGVEANALPSLFEVCDGCARIPRGGGRVVEGIDPVCIVGKMSRTPPLTQLLPLRFLTASGKQPDLEAWDGRPIFRNHMSSAVME